VSVDVFDDVVSFFHFTVHSGGTDLLVAAYRRCLGTGVQHLTLKKNQSETKDETHTHKKRKMIGWIAIPFFLDCFKLLLLVGKGEVIVHH
jgi:hypothetical protein